MYLNQLRKHRFPSWSCKNYRYLLRQTGYLIRCMQKGIHVHLSFLILIGVVLNGYGKSFAQIKLTMKTSSIARIVKDLEKQTDYTFFYNQKDFDKFKSVDMDLQSDNIEDMLDNVFSGQAYSYEIKDKVIVLKPIADTPAQTTASLADKRSTAQEPITGTVTDSLGQVLPGVSVTIKGSRNGSSTDQDGAFEIDAGKGDVLVFRLMGYETQEVTIGDQDVIQVTLPSVSEGLDEVVVIGYGTVRRGDLTGAVAQVKAEDITAYPSASPLQALAGRAAGAQVRQGSGAPGAPTTVRIRGNNSILGDNEPLYVVDGFPIDGNPTQINNTEIESMEILKDASATAIYGARGANGVVLITTKQGRVGATSVNFESSYSSQQLIRKLDLMNAREYAQFYNRRAINDGDTPFFSDSDINSFGEGFDWQDFVFRQAPMYTAALNINGGDEKTQFSVSGSMFDQQGIVEGSDYQRYSLQSSLKHKISDKFHVSVSSVLSKLATERKDSGGDARGRSMISGALSAAPTLSPFNPDGSYLDIKEPYPFLGADLINPINYINEQTNTTGVNSVLTNAALTYNITPELSLKVLGGIENRDERRDQYISRNFINSEGSADVIVEQFTSLLNENTLNYSKSFNDAHHLDAFVGFTYQDFLTRSLSGSGLSFLSDVFGTDDLGSAQTPNPPGSGYEKAVLLSYLGRVNYNYKDRYLLTASLRRDGSSRYSTGYQWGWFPSGAVAWRLSNEPFMEDLKSTFSDLKLRTSYGVTGSQAVDPYQTLTRLFPGRTIFDGTLHTTFSPENTLPGLLRWESTHQFDVGLDVGFLDNRILVNADYYVKNTRDLLNTVQLPASLGYTTTYQNVGQIQNKGLELGVDAQVLTNEFKWDINANIAFNRNKVVTLYNGEDILRDEISTVIIRDVTSILREGRPLGQFWGYVENGYDEDGRIIFQDLNGDGVISQADKTYIGDANPNFIFGFNSTMRYKGFELNIFIMGSQGNDILNASAITNTVDYGFGLNLTRDVFNNHWSPENLNAKYPVPSNNSNLQLSDRFIEDGSYIRLKNIQLAYNLPMESLGANWIKQLQVYASGQNLLTITNYSWWDPETNFRLDQNSYPQSKGVTFGLRAGF